MSDVALVIPARLGSTRLSRKALADIEGKPMVVRVCERAAQARHLGRILVATDSEEIIQAVERAGFEARLTPEHLNSGTERVAYVAKDLKETVIVNLQGDEPVISPLAIEAALDPVLKNGRPMGSAYTRFHAWEEVLQPSHVKVITDASGDAVYFSRYAIPYRQNALSDQEILDDPCFGKHLGIYVYQREILLQFPNWERPVMEKAESLEQLRALHRGVKIGMGRTAFGGQSVDTQEDLEKARELFRQEAKRA
jgi:3-deoxy-manno-octulosonate cytidylyltransferase (CMP-KDO synthetase)